MLKGTENSKTDFGQYMSKSLTINSPMPFIIKKINSILALKDQRWSLPEQALDHLSCIAANDCEAGINTSSSGLGKAAERCRCKNVWSFLVFPLPGAEGGLWSRGPERFAIRGMLPWGLQICEFTIPPASLALHMLLFDTHYWPYYPTRPTQHLIDWQDLSFCSFELVAWNCHCKYCRAYKWPRNAKRPTWKASQCGSSTASGSLGNRNSVSWKLLWRKPIDPNHALFLSGAQLWMKYIYKALIGQCTAM